MQASWRTKSVRKTQQTLKYSKQTQQAAKCVLYDHSLKLSLSESQLYTLTLIMALVWGEMLLFSLYWLMTSHLYIFFSCFFFVFLYFRQHCTFYNHLKTLSLSMLFIQSDWLMYSLIVSLFLTSVFLHHVSHKKIFKLNMLKPSYSIISRCLSPLLCLSLWVMCCKCLHTIIYNSMY